MPEQSGWGDACFSCCECGNVFRSPLYSISRGVERTHFYEDPRVPEVQITQAEEIVSYCSPGCMGKNRNNVLAQEGVTATYPGIGPVECCARCGGPVDMEKFHKAWTEEEINCTWTDESLSNMQPISVQILAVVCQNCGATSESTNLEIKEKSADPV